MNINYRGPKLLRIGSTPRKRVLMGGVQAFSHMMGLGHSGVGSAPRRNLAIKNQREQERAVKKRKILALRNK